MTETATKPMGPLSTHEACALHKAHDPIPAYCEIHHIIPQAWQLHWQPPTPWPNGGPSPDHAGVTLWDARTVTLCRSGHGNVHYWLVKIMRAIEVCAGVGMDVEDAATWPKALTAVRATAADEGHAPGHADVGWSIQAVTRYAATGGSIADLIANHLWGQI